MASSVQEIFEIIKANEIRMIDFRFTDLFGVWHHFSLSARELSEDTFEEGLGFDGSSIRGFQTIDESDMLLIPDVATAFVDPIVQRVVYPIIHRCDGVAQSDWPVII